MSLLIKDLRFIAVVAVAALVIVAGCGRRSAKSALARLGAPREQITSYKVTKPELVDPTLVARSSAPSPASAPATEQQTLGLIVPVGDKGWFFKLTGDLAAVEPQHEAFLQFITSIKFSPAPNSKPTWTLPPSWKQLPGSQFRFATIQLPEIESGTSEPVTRPLEISVSEAGGDVLANINRWRGQLNLKSIAASELAETTKPLKIDGHDATLVSLVGVGSGGMSGAPFAGGAAGLPADHPPLTGAPPTSGRAPPTSGRAPPTSGRGAPPTSASPRGAPKSASGELKFEVPSGWKEGPANAFSMVAYKVTEGGKQVDITVSAAGGDLLSNVNRWRGQVGLPPIDPAELAKAAEKIQAFGTSGDYVELVGRSRDGKPTTILGVRADVGGNTWFVKLIGDSELAKSEKSNFEAFVKSLKLP